MGTKFSEKELQLYKTIDEILWKEWDPIGISSFGNDARDEYYSYLPNVYEMARKNAAIKEIAKYLAQIESERMGLFTNFKRCEEVASKIVEYKNQLLK